jgi:RNA polymerase sigma factor (sigma-70 family)
MAKALTLNISEREMIEGCIVGNRTAQEALYNLYAPKMFGICLRYANDYHSGEDILQEGFIKVFNNIHRFRGEGSFEGWLKRIFINTAIEHYRKAMNQTDHHELDKSENNPVDDNALHELAMKDLLAMIQELSPGYRAVFNMYVIEGFSHKEIAEMVGISEGTSKSQLARARTILQKKITTHAF